MKVSAYFDFQKCIVGLQHTRIKSVLYKRMTRNWSRLVLLSLRNKINIKETVYYFDRDTYLPRIRKNSHAHPLIRFAEELKAEGNSLPVEGFCSFWTEPS